MPCVVRKPAPTFTAEALVDGQFKEVKLSDYKGKVRKSCSITFL